MDTDVSYDHDWQLLLGLLPLDIETLAMETGAIRRRREIRSAADLVRLNLVYAQDDASLRGTSAWAHEAGVADLSDQAVLKRLRGSVGLLRALCSRLMAEQDRNRPLEGARLVLVDSTTICRQRSKGTDFRVHVNYDASAGRFSGVELTRSGGGEALDRLKCGPGDILVADQGYPSRLRLDAVRMCGADFLVRFYPANLPLCDESGLRIQPLELCRDLKIGEILDVPVATVAPKGGSSVAGRLVVLRKTDAQALKQIERTRKSSGKRPSSEAELAARYVMIFTSLEATQADGQTVLETYRIRWQVEMAFKRAKGIVSLGETEARDMELCEAKILSKLLLLLMIQAFESSFFPWGYPLPRSKSLASAA